MEKQGIRWLEAAYADVFNTPLKGRVYELFCNYPDNLDGVVCEISSQGAIHCDWSLSELVEFYKFAE